MKLLSVCPEARHFDLDLKRHNPIKANKFVSSNSSYVIWFTLYFTIAWRIFGADFQSFIFVSLIYGVSISIALSPIGEATLRITGNCSKPITQQEKDYLIPIYEEVYQNAQYINPQLNKNLYYRCHDCKCFCHRAENYSCYQRGNIYSKALSIHYDRRGFIYFPQFLGKV